VIVVNAGAADIGAAMEVVRACVKHMISQGIHQWDEIYPDRGTIERDIADKTLFLAMEEQSLRGMIVLNEKQPAEYAQIAWKYADGKMLVVHRLVVSPVWQGKGIGSRLMHFAEDYGRRNGYAAIRLDVFVHNPSAVGLYTKRQYRNVGTVQFRKGAFYCFEKSM